MPKKYKKFLIKKNREIYKKIFKLFDESGLPNGEFIILLECAKIDIILNDGMIGLDGNSGLITGEK